MKIFLIAIFTLVLSTSVLSEARAGAGLELKWHELDKFTDVRATNDTRSQFHKRVKRNFEDFFQQLADQLPEGYSWQVTITNIDLAGDVDYFVGGAGNPLRVIKDIHSPAITFTHVLRDEHGDEVISAEEELRDMGFMQSVRSVNENDPFRYEKKMLEDWFNKELEPAVKE